MLGLTFLNFLMLNHPVVVLVEESEDLAEVLWLLLHQGVEDIVFSPLDLLVVIKIIGLKKFLLDLGFVEVLKVFWVGCSLDVSSAFLDHFKD